MKGVHHHEVSEALRHRARNSRHQSTDAERAMWRILRDRRLTGFKFRRQVPFKNYILDFVCYEQRLIVEIDGGQHADSQRDRHRDAVLAAADFSTVRYWNSDVLKNREGVTIDLLNRLL
jgi:very-short-patch-repair endonuclease